MRMLYSLEMEKSYSSNKLEQSAGAVFLPWGVVDLCLSVRLEEKPFLQSFG